MQKAKNYTLAAHSLQSAGGRGCRRVIHRQSQSQSAGPHQRRQVATSFKRLF